MVAPSRKKGPVFLFKEALFFFVLLAALFLWDPPFIFSPGWAEANPVKFWIGQTYYEAWGQRYFMDVAPYISQGRTYVPVRFLAYALGVKEEGVQWDGATQSVTLSREEVILNFQLGSFLLKRRVDKGSWIALMMDVAPQMKSNRVFLPVRFLAMGLGYSVSWEQEAQQVTLIPGNSSWVEELLLEPNPVQPEKGLNILVRTPSPSGQVEVRFQGARCSSEPNEFWRQREDVSLQPGGPGEWVVGLIAPGRPGIYPVEVKVGGFIFTCEEWLLKVYPQGFLQQPGYETAEEAVKARFLQDFPDCTLKKIEYRSLLPDDERDPRFHALYLLTFYQPYDMPALPAGTHSVFYYVLKDGPSGLWRALSWGTGP